MQRWLGRRLIVHVDLACLHMFAALREATSTAHLIFILLLKVHEAIRALDALVGTFADAGVKVLLRILFHSTCAIVQLLSQYFDLFFEALDLVLFDLRFFEVFFVVWFHFEYLHQQIIIVIFELVDLQKLTFKIVFDLLLFQQCFLKLLLQS